MDKTAFALETRVCELMHEKEELTATIERLRSALSAIAKGESGAIFIRQTYSRNVIDAMKTIALDAIRTELDGDSR